MLKSPKRQPKELVEQIRGERRCNRRYTIPLSLRWDLIRRRKVEASGMGTTIDLSSGGILFQAETSLPIGYTVTLSIAWPAFIDGFPPVQLVASGVVVRADGNRNAIRVSRHEFRAIAASHRNSGAAGTSNIVSISIC